MKKYFRHIVIVLLASMAMSCEDVIDVNVPEAAPRLVIEASLDWEKGTLGNEQTIKLSTSKPYFDDNEITAVVGASVKVTNDSDGMEFVFEDQNNGLYTTSSFIPQLNQSYTLEVVNDDETYIAKETLTPVTAISKINQSTEGGFDDENLEVTIYFDDPANQENYYLTKFQEQTDVLPTFFDIKDEFTDGNLMSVFFEKHDDENTNEEAFVPGDVIDISLYGISKQYYNFMHLLIEQAEYAGDPFSTTPVPLKGNCINQTNPSNYAFGYFRLTEVVKATYTFQ